MSSEARNLRRREQRAAAKAVAKEAAADGAAAEAAPDGKIAPTAVDQDQPPNGVLVIRVDQDGGGITTVVQPVGDVRVAEIDTLLALGRKAWQSTTGIGD